MLKGTIKTFNAERHFGFIAPDDGGEDIHFSARAVQRGSRSPTVGAKVDFDVGPGNNPGQVTAIRVVIREQSPVQTIPEADQSSHRARLPEAALFPQSFYDEQGRLRQELFYNAAEELAGCFKGAELKSSQFRQLYQAFLGFAGPLRDGRLDFNVARERFGVFYVERIVRQVERGILPKIVKDFFDVHRESALRAIKEMLGLFRYLTNVYCYFGDEEKDSSRNRTKR